MLLSVASITFPLIPALVFLFWQTHHFSVAMTCHGCKNAISKILSTMEGVTSTDIDVSAQSVTVIGWFGRTYLLCDPQFLVLVLNSPNSFLSHAFWFFVGGGGYRNC